MTSTYLDFGNLILIISNLAFLLPMKSCLSSKKYLCAAVYGGIAIVSSLYHLCKWGPDDGFGYGGFCINGLSFQEYYAFDFFFSQMTIPTCASFFINPKKAAVELSAFIHENGRMVKKRILKNKRVEDDDDINGLYPKGDGESIGHQNNDHLVFKYVNLDDYVHIADSDCGGSEEGIESVVMVGNERIASKLRETNHDGLAIERPSWLEFDAIQINCSHCGCGMVIKQNKVAIMNNVFYYKIASWKKTALASLENFYLVFHVLVISTAIKIVGTSVLYVTLPLILCNLSFVLVIIIQSYMVESHNKPMRTIQVGSQVDHSIFNQRTDTYQQQQQQGNGLNHLGHGTYDQREYHHDSVINYPRTSMSTYNDYYNTRIESPYGGGTGGEEGKKQKIKVLMPFFKSLWLLGYVKKWFKRAYRYLVTTRMVKKTMHCFGSEDIQTTTATTTSNGKFTNVCEARQDHGNLRLYEHILGFNLIRSIQWSLSDNGGYCCYELTRNKLISSIISLGFAVIAIMLFASQNYIPTTSYWLTHSMWHVLGAVGQYIVFSMVL